MKRIVLALVFAALSLTAVADERELLLAGDGKLFTVESVFNDSTQKAITSNRYLTLTVQDGDKTSTQIVPASTTTGSHVNPALAYDADSKTLFVFWEAARNGGLASDLLFCSYQDGKWGQVTALDTVDYDLRVNLSIALTRKTEDTTVNGGQKKVILNEINVHAVWWQVGGGGAMEWARYAMLTIDKGNVAKDGIQVMNLRDFLIDDAGPDTRATREIFRHPAIFESAAHDTVDVVFGDPRNDKMHRVTIQPTVQAGRIRIPIGKHRDVATPTVTTFAAEGVGSVSSGADNIAYYYTDKDSVKYILYKDGAWSPVRSIALSDKLSNETAVSALRRMVSSD